MDIIHKKQDSLDFTSSYKSVRVIQRERKHSKQNMKNGDYGHWKAAHFTQKRDQCSRLKAPTNAICLLLSAMKSLVIFPVVSHEEKFQWDSRSLQKPLATIMAQS